MSYSIWGSRGSGHWYTYWCVQPDNIKETKDNAIFEICTVCAFTAKQLRDDMEKCINIVGNKDKTPCPGVSLKKRLNELKKYMNEFLDDIEEEYS